jgi:UDP-N-acetylglucosamine 2-epimerase (non-hydrolysing)
MAPVIRELRCHPWARVSVLCTAQHRHLATPLLRFFDIVPEHDIDAMTEGQTLPDLTARLLRGLPPIFHAVEPHIVLAQGDTTTVMTTALACFYSGISFGHIEAGLRTGNLRDPFPEEFNRIVASRLATLNFAPTERSRANLLREGVDPNIVFVTGNTVVDTLQWVMARAEELPLLLPPEGRVLLVTLHRRESFGGPMQCVFAAIRKLIAANEDLLVIYPLHPNPCVAVPARKALGDIPRVMLCTPLDYAALIAVMQRSYLVLTDSGGIQEEAPSLGKPVLIARETTERPEAVEAGVACLVGTDTERIVQVAQHLLDNPNAYEDMVRVVSPFGDGKASARIADALANWGHAGHGVQSLLFDNALGDR